MRIVIRPKSIDCPSDTFFEFRNSLIIFSTKLSHSNHSDNNTRNSLTLRSQTFKKLFILHEKLGPNLFITFTTPQTQPTSGQSYIHIETNQSIYLHWRSIDWFLYESNTDWIWFKSFWGIAKLRTLTDKLSSHITPLCTDWLSLASSIASMQLSSKLYRYWSSEISCFEISRNPVISSKCSWNNFNLVTSVSLLVKPT